MPDNSNSQEIDITLAHAALSDPTVQKAYSEFLRRIDSGETLGIEEFSAAHPAIAAKLIATHRVFLKWMEERQ